ncbi:glycosyltransferase family 2 protein [Desulfosporosinus sp. OT]|uniref:glycosyltransferase family 2 protein n=1 Tax=Desulfosporosinus sp. OT TaxID=913865 RepID=UPI000223A327|nr:glycosyltransferase family 2 protein [Desulfosporosinus sp. OT]EGW37824.1 glycosyl transferase 2 family protein [Desulfosporosinus sp. OT]
MQDNKDKLVAIIIVNYNGFSDTVECIKSLQKITYSNYKIVVVDNGSTTKPSTDEIEFLKKNSRYFETGKNLGFSGGNNYGIRQSEKFEPAYYLLLNNDTVVEADFLNKLVDAAERQEHIGITIGKINYYSDPDTAWYCGGEFNFESGTCRHYTVQENGSSHEEKLVTFATGCLMLIPTEVIKKVGLMSEDYFLYCEDTDYCAKVLLSGYKILYIPSSLIYHKVSASTGERSAVNQYYYVRNSMIVIRKYAKRKMLGYAKFLYMRFKDVARGRLNSKYVLKALRDFSKGVMGQYDFLK